MDHFNNNNNNIDINGSDDDKLAQENLHDAVTTESLHCIAIMAMTTIMLQ